jgi:hypothetical protein
MKLKEYSNKSDHVLAFCVQSDSEIYSHRNPKSILHFALFGHSYWFDIPAIIKPKQEWCEFMSEGTPRGYTKYIRREYGVSLTKEALFIRYGIQPGCWSKNDKKNSDHSNCYFLPWNETRRVRYDFFDRCGRIFRTVHDKPNGRIDFDSLNKAQEEVPKHIFTFNDFDGEEITVTCYEEEMEWHYGTGWFKWIEWFRKPIIKRRLDLSFDKEIGYEKGSWKGGTMGHSVDISYDELPIEALKRYGTEIEYYKNHGKKPRGFTNIKEIFQ